MCCVFETNHSYTAVETQTGQPRESKLLLVALSIVALLGVVVAGGGVAVYGVHQNWWSWSALQDLSQLHALILMSAGGALALVSIVIASVVHNRCKVSTKQNIQSVPMPFPKLMGVLNENEWTFIRQEDGRYTVAMKHSKDSAHPTAWIEQLQCDRFASELKEIQERFSADQPFVKTSPIPKDADLTNQVKTITVCEGHAEDLDVCNHRVTIALENNMNTTTFLTAYEIAIAHRDCPERLVFNKGITIDHFTIHPDIPDPALRNTEQKIYYKILEDILEEIFPNNFG